MFSPAALLCHCFPFPTQLQANWSASDFKELPKVLLPRHLVSPTACSPHLCGWMSTLSYADASQGSSLHIPLLWQLYIKALGRFSEQSPGSLLNFPNNPSADEEVFPGMPAFPYIESQLGNYPWTLMFLDISTWGRCIWRTYQHPSRNPVGQEMEV